MYGFLWFGATTPSSPPPPPPLSEQLLVLTHLLLCTLESQDLTAHISIHVRRYTRTGGQTIKGDDRGCRGHKGARNGHAFTLAS